MSSWGQYPGYLLAVDPGGVWFGECFGPAHSESGGTVSLAAFIGGANHDWVRQHFSEDVLTAAIADAKSQSGAT